MKRTFRTDINKEKFLNHLKFAGGNISMACQNAMLSRTQAYEWLKTDEIFKKKVFKVYKSMQAFAECKLLKKVKQGDTMALQALINRVKSKS
ncbi:hypothetical protein ACTJKN_20970 [Pedobacter sp. 22163]|uniref:hypothetical protein n=1 Tax=Pedobacter sp. 22163 TaxID=3453883 RepID=UPI003F82A0F9